jgi:hypothetical protein
MFAMSLVVIIDPLACSGKARNAYRSADDSPGGPEGCLLGWMIFSSAGALHAVRQKL